LLPRAVEPREAAVLVDGGEEAVAMSSRRAPAWTPLGTVAVAEAREVNLNSGK
jgi:hypothetical protein